MDRLMVRLLHNVQCRQNTHPFSPLVTVLNVTDHPPTVSVSVPIVIGLLLCNGPSLTVAVPPKRLCFFHFSSHRMHCIDATYCCRCRCLLSVSLCACVCVSVTRVSCLKAAEPIQDVVWGLTWVNPSKMYWMRVDISPRKEQFCGFPAHRKQWESAAVYAAKRIIQSPLTVSQHDCCNRLQCSDWSASLQCPREKTAPSAMRRFV